MKPRLEPFEVPTPGRSKANPAKQSRSVLVTRGSSLPPPAEAFWKCHINLHTQRSGHKGVRHAVRRLYGHVGEYEFDGSQRLWSDVIKKISLRFPVPTAAALDKDPFNSAPADSWEAAKARAEAESEAPLELEDVNGGR
eukprot:4373135-Prymnesium_polylepis.1